MKKNISFLSVLLGTFFISSCFVSYANNVQVTNVTLKGQNTTEGYTTVQFDLSWENSYHINDGIQEFWDAAWIFIKYKVGDSDKWEHATLSATGHLVSSDATLELPTDMMGAYIYTKAVTNQPVNNNWQGIELRWDYGTDGVSENALVDVKVFGIEMVYVPTSKFWIGDGTYNSSFHTANTPIVTGDFDKYPYQILSEDALTLGGTDTMSIGTNNNYAMNCPCAGDDFSTTVVKQLLSGFPKGYNAFYCMKYELTQAQYVEFLNTLNRTQQQTNTNSDISQDNVPDSWVMVGYGGSGGYPPSRNAITCPSSGNGTTDPIIFTTSYKEIPCNFLTWEMGLAYSDWAGIRPMTELEYEKACRGIFEPVANEIATGKSPNTQRNWQILSGTAGKENETIQNIPPNPFQPAGYMNHFSKATNMTYNSTDANPVLKVHGPLRSGILAASNFDLTDNFTVNDVVTRDRAGATMYGIMEMTGNLCEPAIFVGNEDHRLFIGDNGDGEIDTNGLADNLDWPHTFPYYRGGSWNHGSLNGISGVGISNRVTSIYGGIYGQHNGWRCVRSID